ncbi:MAG: class I SAM-dependent methyltransferase [Nitrospirota bacterium]|nr:class I SAM-dependent methyltransferase [Nitrospirota bacterium]
MPTRNIGRKLRDLGRWLRTPISRRRAMRRVAEFHSRQRPLDEVVQWAMAFGTRGRFRVKTIQIASEITALAREVDKISPQTILEIGTSEGGTALIWAQLASQRVITCDITPPGPRGALLTAFPPPMSKCRVTLLTGDSHSREFARRLERELNGAAVDFLFIDGDHSEGGVEADYELYRPFVRSGGIIAFHDIAERQDQPGNEVQHFWKRLKDRGPVEEFIQDRNQVGFGIGLVRV